MAIIYYFTDTNSADVTDGSDFNKTLNTSAPPSEVEHEKTNVKGGASDVVVFTYSTVASEPATTTWDAGDYVAYADLGSLGGNVSMKIAICRINSAGTLQETLGTSSSFSSVDLHSFTHNIAVDKSVTAGDRLQVRLLVSRGASHGNQNIRIDIGFATGYSRLETPITIGGVARRRINIT